MLIITINKVHSPKDRRKNRNRKTQTGWNVKQLRLVEQVKCQLKQEQSKP